MEWYTKIQMVMKIPVELKLHDMKTTHSRVSLLQVFCPNLQQMNFDFVACLWLDRHLLKPVTSEDKKHQQLK